MTIEVSPGVATSAKEVIASLPERFTKAKESGDLLFFPSTVHNHVENGIEVSSFPSVIEALGVEVMKPALPTPHFDAEKDQSKANKKSKSDPFAPPYVPGLYLGELKDVEEDTDYVVFFNKFSIVPNHILLVTKEFHSQTAPLMSSDLVQAYQLLLAARAAGKRFFAFYNCGDLSGASQPHKHLQLLPIEDDGPPIERIARSVNLEVPGFAGMLLVKSEAELEAVKKEGVVNILRGTGVGSVHELQVQGNDGEPDLAV
ncbi:bifunctional AP-4-A phosphorylase/ADP sulfurylase [Steccherinum ochraceum]|uniref:Bifunctional AP-4-A phosphorylase/ADP sulfurylase n=1 Tax=Steccherinum ochraceum TaxID=92696 RepID=A0A4V2MV22_9APHY|nr:bifunctional AP-4-A phosphorylase/ADP sulfurylase [Steccherinum ochraceum]